MSYAIPSHQNSNNERSERRQNHKDESKRIIDAKKTPISVDAAAAKFDKLAAGFVAAEKVSIVCNQFRVRVGAGKSFYPVYKINGAFACECRDRAAYGFCAHQRAAELFAAKIERDAAATAERYTATLRYGNRKGLDFEKQRKFSDRREASEWLATESFNKFHPEGEVTDVFGSVVFEITDEFFDVWGEV